MMKNAILALAITSGFIAHASITIDARLLVSKAAQERDIQRSIVMDDAENCVVAAENVEDRMLEATVVEHTEDGVVVSFKVIEHDNDGNAVVIAEPTVKCVWDKEAVIRLGDSDENGNTDTISLTVIASRN